MSFPLSRCVWSRSKGCRTLSTTLASVQYANWVLGMLPLSSDETEEELSSSDDDHLSPKALQDVFYTLELLHGWRLRVKTCCRGCPSPLAHICMQLGTNFPDQQFSVILSSLLICSLLMGLSLLLCTGGPRVETPGRTPLSYFLANNGFYTFPNVPVLFSHSFFHSLSPHAELPSRPPSTTSEGCLLLRNLLKCFTFCSSGKNIDIKINFNNPPPNQNDQRETQMFTFQDSLRTTLKLNVKVHNIGHSVS